MLQEKLIVSHVNFSLLSDCLILWWNFAEMCEFYSCFETWDVKYDSIFGLSSTDFLLKIFQNIYHKIYTFTIHNFNNLTLEI